MNFFFIFNLLLTFLLLSLCINSEEMNDKEKSIGELKQATEELLQLSNGIKPKDNKLYEILLRQQEVKNKYLILLFFINIVGLFGGGILMLKEYGWTPLSIFGLIIEIISMFIAIFFVIYFVEMAGTRKDPEYHALKELHEMLKDLKGENKVEN